MKAISIRGGLLCSTVAGAILYTAAPASAQAQPSPTGQPAPTGEPQAEGAEPSIVVTGTRIVRPELAFPNPVQSFSAEAIEQSGNTNLTDFLAETPALVNSRTNERNGGVNLIDFQSAGVNALDLRNLGIQRTLVLVDGRRHVAGLPGVSAVDINTIPTDLIQRVDVLTGGVSAIYGADGVSGVINFVLKRDFEGIRARGQIGISEHGDAGNRFGSILAGRNFADGRGNIAVAYEFSETDRFDETQRPFTGDPFRRFELLRNPADFPDTLAVPDRILFNDVRFSDSAPNGAVDIDLDDIPDFDGDGNPYNRGRLLPGSGGRTIGGSSTRSAGYNGDFFPQTTRHNVNALASFKITPELRLFAEGKYVRAKSYSEGQPTFDSFLYLAPDNAFLRRRFGNLAPDGAFISRDNFEMGRREDRLSRETFRGVLGADGELSDHFRYEVSYVYGRSTSNRFRLRDRVEDRYFAAVDAIIDPRTGQPTCRINLFPNEDIDPENYGGPPITFKPGECVPLNLLGTGVVSKEALDFVLASHNSQAKITQQVFSGSLSGDLGFLFSLPGGPIGFALGAEYRKETSRSTPADLLQKGLILDSAVTRPVSGQFDVKEVFGEISLPLLKDLPFAHRLSLGGAVRFSDYSTIGSTTAWKVDGTWAPVRDITFRGTYSRSVRAPNIAELFAPQAGTFARINDPCDPTHINEGSSFRPANCLALLQGLGFTPAQISGFSPESQPSITRPGLQGGNPNLKEEAARTWTAGVVLQPRFIPGLTAALDWYDIKLEGAINTATANQLVALCVDQPVLGNAFCQQVTRDPKTGFVTNFLIGPQNVARFTTSGADLTLNYRITPSADIGTFNLRLVGGYLNDLTVFATIGAQADSNREEKFAPKYLADADLTWTLGDLSLNYGISWFSKTRRFTIEQLRANPDIADPSLFWFNERWQHDIQASYNIARRFTIYGGVRNLTDRKPDVAAAGDTGSYPVSGVGRFFYLGVKLALNHLP